MKRRFFLQTAALTIGAGYATRGFGFDGPPAFAPMPTYDPSALYLTWQRDPTTTKTVQWLATKAEAEVARPVWYAADGMEIWQQTPAVGKPFPNTELTLFRAELTGLTPGTEYRFRVGLDSAERRFRTMPAKATNTIQFVSGGDSGVGTAAIATNQLAAKQEPYFAVLGGDLAYENGLFAPIWVQFLKNYSANMIDAKKRLIPMLACLGNHEVMGGYAKTRREAPYFYACFDGLFTETGYNVLDFGDYMSLVLLDTNHTSPIGGEQTSWLEKTLRDRQECPNVLVYNHVPAYPSVREFGDSSNVKAAGPANRKHWVPLFERYNVDVVLEHHDHAFKRTHPLMDGRVDANGIIYLGDGSWGKLRRPDPPEKRSYLAATDESYHLTVHRIEGDQRFHVALSDAGKVVDVCTTTKRSNMSHGKVT
ncbi:MAG: metallophosphoesterase family protein [Planctomycetota bacterium]